MVFPLHRADSSVHTKSILLSTRDPRLLGSFSPTSLLLPPNPILRLPHLSPFLPPAAPLPLPRLLAPLSPLAAAAAPLLSLPSSAARLLVVIR